MNSPEDIKQELREKLTLADPGLIGCRRRSAWDEEPSWRFLRGNALLHAIGERWRVPTPLGEFEFYRYNGRQLLQFRGGTWSPWWIEDFYDVWSIARAFLAEQSLDLLVAGIDIRLPQEILVLHENRGELDVKEVVVPDSLDPHARVHALLTEAAQDPPGRIPKSGPRALRVCHHCPHKQRCDAYDKLHGEDDDWSPNYPVP